MNMQLVAFKAGQEEYAIPIEQVREIISYVPVTMLPETPAYFQGIINVRGKIIPVVNFAAKLGLTSEQEVKQIVIVETQGKEIGLTVDIVTEVIQAASENFAELGSLSGKTTVKTAYKLENRIILVLDIADFLQYTAA